MYPEIFKNELTKRTPWIVMEPGKIFIMGRSIPENPGEFFRPVYEWISQYVPDDDTITKIILGFEYINTSSTKWIYTILKELSGINVLSKASITWYYEEGDEDMSELGLILKSLVDCHFKLIEVEDMSKSEYAKILSDLAGFPEE